MITEDTPDTPPSEKNDATVPTPAVGPNKSKKTMKPRAPRNPLSLVSPAGMGGIIGGGGYDFQKRYITCRMVEWVVDETFRQVIHEGLGDVDVLYFEEGQGEWREHIQVKDHEVGTSELRGVLDRFIEIEKGAPGLYRRFTLACPSLTEDLRSLNSKLDRYHGAGDFYGSGSGDAGVAPVTKSEIEGYVRGTLRLTGYEAFVLSSLNFDTNLHNFHRDKDACIAFIGNLLQKEQFRDRFYIAAEPAYSRLLREVESRRGKTFARDEILATLENVLPSFLAPSVVGTPDAAPRPVLGLTVHNWSGGKFDIEPDHTLDWTPYFDRPTRRVPTPAQWDGELLPQVRSIEAAALQERGPGLVRFRGFCCISTGIAVGNIFREVSGWVTEMHQTQTGAFWRSDAAPAEDYVLAVKEEARDPDGDSIAVLLNVKGDGVEDVLQYLEESGAAVKVLVTMEPPGAAGSLSIRNDREAVAFANQARDILQRVRKRYRTRTVHLFFYGPQALAVFLGQRLTSVGHVHLYEYQEPSYVPSCVLLT
jgi:hypothetical protein